MFKRENDGTKRPDLMVPIEHKYIHTRTRKECICTHKTKGNGGRTIVSFRLFRQLGLEHALRSLREFAHGILMRNIKGEKTGQNEFRVLEVVGAGEHIRGIAIELSFGRRLSLGGIISVGFRRRICVFECD